MIMILEELLGKQVSRSSQLYKIVQRSAQFYVFKCKFNFKDKDFKLLIKGPIRLSRSGFQFTIKQDLIHSEVFVHNNFYVVNCCIY